ncbi:MAG: MmcQ/YjbR family DNA-binding protein [Clostridia bacterium]|nr:MmcQ/YjbR family DNA-binding protein [Clostridia bacterium]
MTQPQLAGYILDAYGVMPDHPFPMDAVSCVFRHKHNRKWFALTMNVAFKTLGIPRDGRTNILNVKCDPLMAGSLLAQPCFLPAYHMNKGKWITVLLDGSTDREQVMALVDMSYHLTSSPKRRKKNG